MAIKQLINELKSLRTWRRVLELQRMGYFKNKEKRILFGEPIPPEDILPLRIATILSLTMVFLVMIVATSLSLNLLPLVANVLLVILFFLIIVFPKICVYRIEKSGRE